jgi:Tfp pilus assembly protein PilN
MKAVNLFPIEERRGPSAGGRSASAAYMLLGALGVLVLMVAAWTLTGKTVKDRRAQLATVEQQAASTEAQAARMAAYSTFADLRKNRAETVASIARSRFDWAHVMHEIARVIPPDAHLTSLSGSVSPTATAPDSGGSALALRGTNPGPALDIVGCANGQANVSRMMSRLRLVDGVTHVTLAESTKNDTPVAAGAPTSGGGDDGECRYNDAVARFDVLILFNAPPAAAAPAAATATAPGTTAPVASTTPTTTTGNAK